MNNQAERSEFYDAVGRLTVAWAFLESGIDLTLQIIHTRGGGKNIEPVLPWTLERKLKYLRKCLNALENLKPLGPYYIPILDKVREESEMRHDMIHGVLKNVPAGSGPAKLSRLLRGNEMPQYKEIEATPHQIVDAGLRAQLHAAELLNLAIFLNTELARAD